MLEGPPWQYDELAHAGPEHLDPARVAGYDAKSQTDIVPDIEVLRTQGLGPGARIVDLGAGTGTFAVAAARAFGHVTAVDVAPAMLTYLRQRVTTAGLTNVAMARAGFLSYLHEGPPADAVFSRNALHHLPDLWKAIALQRLASILRRDGILRLHDLVFDATPQEMPALAQSWFAGAAADPTRGYTRDDFEVHLRTEFSTYRWLLEPMLEQAGFEIVDVDYRRRVYGAYTCRRR